ncbi:MAG: sulfite exporter TauE/SafE family protein [Gemmatimonadaceae bacterium]|nr:sulfite exporter TauE/SafE family protein [Gemmatimonadaceae bacterium]
MLPHAVTLATAAASAVGIGASLGLLGGGGSILTVPVLVHALGIAAPSAVAMSMPVVGLTSLVGAVGHWRAGHVRIQSALAFGGMAMVGAYLGSSIGRAIGGEAQLTLLALLMTITAIAMWRKPAARPPETAAAASARPRMGIAAVVAFAVGLLTGTVGIGGGFLVVPALVLFVGLSMADAIGTSLVVIAMNAAAGLAGYAGHVPIQWRTVAWFSALAALGILAGLRLAPHIPAARLRRAFAVLLVVVGAVQLWPHVATLSSPAPSSPVPAARAP